MRLILTSRLRRETSSARFIAEVDGIRFFAIVAVVVYHLQDYLRVKLGGPSSMPWLGWVLGQGYFGVPVFFALSGFIISLRFAEAAAAGRRWALRDYYLRRVTRLEPPYLIHLLLIFACLVWVNGESAAALLPGFLASAIYCHNLFFGEASVINYVAWSLEVEFQFYTLAPALSLPFLIRNRRTRRAIWLGLMLAGGMGAALDGEWRGHLPITQYFGYFAGGFLLADLYVWDWHGQPKASKAWDTAGAVSLVSLFVLLWIGQGVHAVGPFLVLVLLASCFCGHWTKAVLRQPALYLTGGMCYTIYLYHFYVISAIGYAIGGWLAGAVPGFEMRLLVLAMIAFPVIVVSCGILFVAAEKPFMRRGWWRLKSETGAMQASGFASTSR